MDRSLFRMDETRTIDIEGIKQQYAEQFKSYVPKARPVRNQDTTSKSGKKYKLIIDPPLLNSASPWASELEQIQALYDCPFTGAVTTRTSLLEGFTHDPNVHQYTFFTAGQGGRKAAQKSDADAAAELLSSASISDSKADEFFSAPESQASNLETAAITASSSAPSAVSGPPTSPSANLGTSSLNTYGYSPHTLSEYLGMINEIVGQRHLGTSTEYKKPFILSVTGTPDEIAMAYALLANTAEMDEDLRLAMEVNLSCPNIKDHPPPAYDVSLLAEFLEAIGDSKATYRGRMSNESVPRVGVKLPPYTWNGQFTMVVDALRAAKSSEPGEGSVIDFVTCTNTLGSSLVLESATTTTTTTDDDDNDDELNSVINSESGTGIGGLAGAALHPIALGNVATFRKLLDAYPETEDIMIVGVGGVEDAAGFRRMKKVGAGAVGCATALGRFGVDVFAKISQL